LQAPLNHHYTAKVIFFAFMCKRFCGFFCYVLRNVKVKLCVCCLFVVILWKNCNTVRLFIFNPDNDLALADGTAAYCPPPAARVIGYDLATLPLWYAGTGNCVALPAAGHCAFAAEMAQLFEIATPLENKMLRGVDGCSPWGWSELAKRRLRSLGVGENMLPAGDFIASVRALSNRRTAIGIAASLAAAGVDVPAPALYLTSPDDVARFINSVPRSAIKAPWSGSGKGIAWGIGHVEVPVENFYRGVIRRQGGVVCERYLDKVIDFAMEFSAADGVVTFAGYSLFTCDGAAYTGNILAPDAQIEEYIAGFVGAGALHSARAALVETLSRLLAQCGYSGFLGIDMFVYRTPGGYRLNPCVELNLRMNMGAVSRIFCDRYMAQGALGCYFVSNFRNDGEALALHEKMVAAHPAKVRGGKLVSGYLNLSPVTPATRYIAYTLVEEGAATVASLYGPIA
jgi:hypothetical protein